MRSLRKYKAAQATIEFTFAMVVIMLLIYGMIRVFRWAGMDLAQRRYLQDASLMNIDSGDPMQQLNSDLDIPLPMSAVYHGTVASGKETQ